jgi:hypothetical protein
MVTQVLRLRRESDACQHTAALQKLKRDVMAHLPCSPDLAPTITRCVPKVMKYILSLRSWSEHVLSEVVR